MIRPYFWSDVLENIRPQAPGDNEWDSVHCSIRPSCRPETGLWEITPGKSASVYECFPFILPYNARALSEVPRRDNGEAERISVVPGRFR